MAYLSVAPVPNAAPRLSTNPKISVGVITTGGTGPVTLPDTGQQWPLPVYK